tara:strand:+ start:96 stop:866 length:771 start_codon:yes stop_codon:yes gene_type:complete
MKLTRIGFCGLDESISFHSITSISKLYPLVEWGILLRYDLAGTPRYPKYSWIEELIKFIKDSNIKVNLAGHLCGDYCKDVLIYNNFEDLKKLIGLGFSRFQLNPTPANNITLNKNLYSHYAKNLLKLCNKFPNVEFILQLNLITQPILNHILETNFPSNLSLLNDSSCGQGISIQNIQKPLLINNRYVKTGYAGGIEPNNIDALLEKLEIITDDKEIWIDMESGIRTIEYLNKDQCFDYLDVRKCQLILDACIKNI